MMPHSLVRLKKQLYSYIAGRNAKWFDPVKGKSAQSHNVADTFNPETLSRGIYSEDIPHKYEHHIFTKFLL